MRLRVIGVGSPQGDDAVGLAVGRRLLTQHLPEDVEVLLRERPGLDLLDDLRDADAAVLIDALHAGAEPGRVHSLAARELARGARLSSHELGVGAALALADALGARRPPLRIIGIEIASTQGSGLSTQLEASLETACARVRRAIAELRVELSDADSGAENRG